MKNKYWEEALKQTSEAMRSAYVKWAIKEDARRAYRLSCRHEDAGCMTGGEKKVIVRLIERCADGYESLSEWDRDSTNNWDSIEFIACILWTWTTLRKKTGRPAFDAAVAKIYRADFEEDLF